jgi:hypothetical protein
VNESSASPETIGLVMLEITQRDTHDTHHRLRLARKNHVAR